MLALEAPAASRWDPRAKLLAALLAAAMVLAFSDWPTLAVVTVALAVFFAAGRLLGAWLRLLRSIWLLAAIIFIIDELSYGPLNGLNAVLKLLLLVSLFSAFFLSTDPDDLALALVALKVPYTFAFILAATSNYVPVIGQEAREITDAFQARGLSRGKTPLGTARFYAAILVPLTVATIRRSLRLAEALEARAFGSSQKRTSLRLLQPRLKDWLLAAGAILGCGGIALVHALL